MSDDTKSEDSQCEFGCYGPIVAVYFPFDFYSANQEGFLMFNLRIFLMLKMLYIIWTEHGFVASE